MDGAGTESEGRRRKAAASRLPLLALLGCAGAALLWAAFAPIPEPASREEVFEIPKGTWARRSSGDPVEILPSFIRLTLGLRDVLLLRNLDDVPQTFGPTLMMPGQGFRLPFAVASDYQFACTAHASGQMTILVDPYPETPLQRLRWRIHEGWRRVAGRGSAAPGRNESPT